MRTINIIIFILWFVSGLYFGIGGMSRARLDETQQELDKEKETLIKDTINVKYDNLTFENKYDLKTYLELESIVRVFPWAIEVSSFVSLIIASFSFGLLGGLISLVKEIVFHKADMVDIKIWSVPVLGMLTGLVIFGLSYLLPTVLVKNASELRPITQMFLCLFAGLFAKEFYTKLGHYLNKIFL